VSPFARLAASCYPALVNGAIGLVVRPARTVIGVAAITVIGERITEIDLIIDPVKLASLEIRNGPRSPGPGQD
jgi:RNA polymerase sigma-70 factor (ECF subfamily)